MSYVVDYVYKSKWTVNGYEYIYIYIYMCVCHTYLTFCGIAEKIAEINIYRIEKKLCLILLYCIQETSMYCMFFILNLIKNFLEKPCFIKPVVGGEQIVKR